MAEPLSSRRSATGPTPVGGAGESSAVFLKNPRRDWPDNYPQNRNRPTVISSPRGGGSGRTAGRLLKNPAPGLAEQLPAKPKSSNGHFLSPGERIKGEGER